MSYIDVPDYFVERYAEEFEAWAKHFAKIGPVKSFVLKEGYAAAHSPDPEQGRELIVVKLLARISRAGVEIAPYTERDRANIRRHCEKMARLGVPARMKLKEPPRPALRAVTEEELANVVENLSGEGAGAGGRLRANGRVSGLHAAFEGHDLLLLLGGGGDGRLRMTERRIHRLLE